MFATKTNTQSDSPRKQCPMKISEAGTIPPLNPLLYSNSIVGFVLICDLRDEYNYDQAVKRDEFCFCTLRKQQAEVSENFKQPGDIEKTWMYTPSESQQLPW